MASRVLGHAGAAAAPSLALCCAPASPAGSFVEDDAVVSCGPERAAHATYLAESAWVC